MKISLNVDKWYGDGLGVTQVAITPALSVFVYKGHCACISLAWILWSLELWVDKNENS